eukprot:SAG31_NODE_47432_length_243_cov_13.180556_1_plen_33_part_01
MVRIDVHCKMLPDRRSTYAQAGQRFPVSNHDGD